MIEINDIIKEVSKETKIDIETVDVVCKHVFQETVKMMKHKTDVSDILFNKLFKFKLKKRFLENKQLNYSSK